MEQFVEGKNPYEILGLENGHQRTLDEIKKAYRRLALVKHPDKAKTANAAQEFDELKKAYAILSDKSARGALDDYLEAQAQREHRLAQQDAKRQKLRQELERKEQQGELARSEEEQARARLKVELEALRARAQQEQRTKQQQQQQQQMASAAAAARAGSNPPGKGLQVADDDDETTELLKRTVKVSWDPSVGSYSTEQLRGLFGRKFIVEDIILKDSRKKKKASALVVLDSLQAAGQAAHEVLGDLKNPLLVTPYLKVLPQDDQPMQQQQQQQQQMQAPQATGVGPPAAAGTGDGSASPAVGVSAAGSTAAVSSRSVKRPSKPLFPGAQPATGSCMSGPEETGNSTSASKPADAQAGNRPQGYGSFPGMPAAGHATGYSSFPGMPGGSFEQSVLQKMQQKSQHKQN